MQVCLVMSLINMHVCSLLFRFTSDTCIIIIKDINMHGCIHPSSFKFTELKTDYAHLSKRVQVY